MDKRQFLEAVTEQIRFEKAREMISDELENHIEDQKEAFMSEGISETESYQKAIEDMGDPVEVGISLDRIHRPKMEWKMIMLVLGLSILGLFFQYVMFKDMGSEAYPYNINSQCVYIVIGLAVMMFFCFFDYTRIGLWGKTGAAVLLLLLLYSYFGAGSIRTAGLSACRRIVCQSASADISVYSFLRRNFILLQKSGQKRIYKKYGVERAPCHSRLKIAGLIHSGFTDVNYADSGLFHYQKRMVWRMEEKTGICCFSNDRTACFPGSVFCFLWGRISKSPFVFRF